MKINRARLNKLAEIQLVLEDEDSNFEKELDDEYSKQWIRKELAKGNEWAWCSVRVSARYMGERGDAYLGQCSYESKENFIAANDYYTSMVNEAVDELAKTLEPYFDPCLFETDDHQPRTCITCVADA